MLKFAGVVLTDESVQAARKGFADNALRCADGASRGIIPVSNPAEYIRERLEYAEEMESGRYPVSVSLLQKAYYIQTGEKP